MIFKFKNLSYIIIFLMVFNSSVFAAPQSGKVTSGDAIISSISPDNTVINQTSDKAVIEWGSFDIGAGETVTFNQNSSSSVILNRITGGNPTNIFGNLNANGKVFLINQSGIVVGNGAVINAGGFLASTADISKEDFENGNFSFTGATADIINSGSINISDGGYAVLMGRQVTNDGLIAAKLGQVYLTSGTDFRLTFSGSDLIGINIETGAIDSLTSNSGTISADGSIVVMSSKGVTNLLQTAVNNTGVITANAINNQDGVITLTADGGAISSQGELNSTRIDVKATAGNIDISNFETDNADFNADTGNITISSSSANNAQINATAGNIDISNFEADNADFNADTGNIKISSSSANNAQINATVGNIDISDTIINKFTATAGGKIDANNISSSYINVSSAGGEINITNANSENVFIDALKSAGKVTYTQTNGKNLNFNHAEVSSADTVRLNNSAGTINSDFDYVNNTGNIFLLANRINLVKSDVNNMNLSSGLFDRLMTNNLSLEAVSDIVFTTAIAKNNLNLTLKSLNGEITSTNLLEFRSLNLNADRNITLNTSISSLSALSNKGNINIVNNGTLTISRLSARNGSIDLTVGSGNLQISGLAALKQAKIKTDAGAVVIIQGSGSDLRLNLENGGGTSLEVVNNGKIDLKWADNNFTKLTLRSLGDITVENNNTFNSSGDIFIQANTFNTGNPLEFNATNNLILKIADTFQDIKVSASNLDIDLFNANISSSGNLNFTDLDNDGFSIIGNNLNIVAAGSIGLANTAQANIFNISSANFDFIGNSSAISSTDISIKSLGDIKGIGRITSETAYLEGATIGTSGGSSIFLAADKATLMATSQSSGETINISAPSWFSGIKNYNFITSGNASLNGREVNKSYHGIIQKGLSANFFPLQTTHLAELPEYKLLRNMEELQGVLTEDFSGRPQPGLIIKSNGKYSIR